MVSINGNFDIDELEQRLAYRTIFFNDLADLSQNNLPHLRSIFPIHFRNLAILNLNDCQIVTISRSTFKLLGNLESLNLSNNLIGYIPTDLLSQCYRLKRVSLRNNRLQTFNISAFEQIPFLEHLDLSSNLIRKVTSTSFRNLKHLNLANNLIDTFYGNTYDRLDTLNLSFNQLIKLVNSLTRNIPNLIDLDASNNQISTISSTTFKYAPKLEKLLFNNNRLTRFTTDLLSDTCKLKHLELNNNQIDYLELKSIHCPFIEKLGFASNLNLDFNGFENLVNLIRLDLSNCSFHLTELPPLNCLKRLEQFNFAKNYFLIMPNQYFHVLNDLKLLLLDHSSSIVFGNLTGSLMSMDNCLVRLSMSNCNIVDVSAYFRYLFLLTHLNLSFNQISKLTPDCFKDLISLEHLYLNSNELQFIHSNTFRFMLRLKMCDLQMNRFETLNRRLFETTVELDELLYDRHVRLIDEVLVG